MSNKTLRIFGLSALVIGLISILSGPLFSGVQQDTSLEYSKAKIYYCDWMIVSAIRWSPEVARGNASEVITVKGPQMAHLLKLLDLSNVTEKYPYDGDARVVIDLYRGDNMITTYYASSTRLYNGDSSLSRLIDENFRKALVLYLKESDNQPIAGVQDLNLSETEEKQLTAQANQGDNEAAIRLFNFYEMVKLKHSEAMIWLKKAANNGSARAQCNLGIKLSYGNDKAVPEAIYWLEKAKQNGEPRAGRLLEDLQKSDPLAFLLALEPEKHNVKPGEGYVADEKTAVKIAEAILIPIYGEKQIADERPFQAELKNGVWSIKGTLHYGKGGVAEIEIAKDDGRILRVSHEK